MTRRHLCYLTGTRADFGLMESTLRSIARHHGLRLDVVVTGTHLSAQYGMTVREIEAAGLSIAARIEVDTRSSSGASMALNVARTLEGMVGALQAIGPDVLVLLGDRGEMLAGAIAAVHLNLPVVHIHGGERSGTIDEPVRHAISKLAHHHFVATAQSRERLIAMGELADTVHVTGAPGLDGLSDLATQGRSALCSARSLDPSQPIGLFVYHPVVQQAGDSAAEARALIEACLQQGWQLLALTPNSDAGGNEVRAVLASFETHPQVRVVAHLPRGEFVSWLASCDAMVGNSSSGIIEAASFGTPVVNIGSRQRLRERNDNVVDVATVDASFGTTLQACRRRGRFPPRNVYGDGRSGERIVALLTQIDLSETILSKCNAY